METSILTSKGQLLIPKRLRTKYGIEAGVKVVFEEKDGAVVIRPMNQQFFKSYRGILSATGLLAEEMREMKAEEQQLEEQKLQMHKTRKKQ
ncbi:hypothetical protein BH10BAC3_BH10BAC3_09170 [soil metagenome]